MKKETIEQREQSQACLYYAESRKRKAEGQYARVSVEMPENEMKESLNKEVSFEIENRDIHDEYTVKF